MSFPLDEQQRPAAQNLDEHVFLAAGAGSGKTRVLVERYLNALERSRWDPALPARMLAITFTEKAAQQMRDRILERLGERVRQSEDQEEKRGIVALAREMESAPISTIHGFCSRLLKEHAIEAGIDPRFRVPDEVSQFELRGEVLDGLLREGDADLTLLAGEFGWAATAGAIESLRELRRSLGLPAGELAGENAERLANEQRGLVLGLLRDGVAASIAALPAALDALCSHFTDRMHPTQKGRDQLALALALANSPEPGSADPAVFAALLATMNRFPSGGARIDDGGELKKKWERLKKEIGRDRDRAAITIPNPGDPAAALVAASYRLLHRYAEGIAGECGRRGWLDFDDLQLGALALLDSDAELAGRIAAQYRYVLVDELQDSNQLQHRLVRRLVPDGTDPRQRSLFVVGDHRQSIYAFRNADVEVFKLEMARRQAAGELSQLSKNYRSHPSLVDYFNGLFPAGDFPPMEPERKVPDAEKGAPRTLLQLTPQRKGELTLAQALDAAAASLAACLKEAWLRGLPVKSGEARRALRWGDVAILVRSGSAITPLARALSEAGIPFEASGGREYWLRQELLDLEDLIAALDDPYRRFPLAKALRGDLIGMTTADLLLIMDGEEKRGGRDGGELLARLGAAARGEVGLSEDGSARAGRLLGLIERFSGRLRRLPLRRLVAELVEASGFDLHAATQPRALKVLRNLRQLEELLAELEGNGRLSVGEWLDYMKRQRDVAPKREEAWVPEEGGSLLRILTIHAAKGLEFPLVVLADIDRDTGRQSRLGDLPGLRLDVDDEAGERRSQALLGVRLHDEEEKLPDAVWLWIEEQKEIRERAEAERLLYVAMTRAEDYLLLSGVLQLRDEDPRAPLAAGEAGPERSFLRRISQGLASHACASLCSVQIAGEDALAMPAGNLPREAESSAGADPDPARWEPLIARLPQPARREIPVTSLALIESCPLRWVLERRLDAGGLLPGENDPWSPAEGGEDAGPGGRSFGTGLHRILEAWDFRADAASAFAAACPSDLSPAHRGEAERVLLPLFGGDLPWVQRLRAGRRFRREEPFLLELGGVVLSGQVDLVFEWEGADILVDWKSDRIEGRSGIDERVGHHQLQMALYAHALAEAGRPVRQALLCFLRPGQFRQSDISPRQLVWAANKARKLANLASETSRIAFGADAAGGGERLPRPGSPPCSDCPFRGNFCPREYRSGALTR